MMSAPEAKTILLVEKEVLFSDTTSKTIQKYGFNVVCVNSGKKALELAAGNMKIDLILMSIDPDDGIDGAEAAKKILEAREIPLVFFSSHAGPEIIEKTGGITSYGYIVKNSGETVLIATIKMAFRLFEAHGKLSAELQERRRIEHQLRESEKRYRTVFENTGTATIIIEEDTTLGLCNAEYERLSGYAREEIEGKKSWTEFVVKEDLERMVAQHKLRRQNHDSAMRHYEFQFIRRSGEVRDIDLVIDTIHGTGQSVASLSDITERKRAEDKLRASEARYRTLIDLAVDGILLGSFQGVITEANSRFCQMVGMNSEELIGKHISELPFTAGSIEKSPFRFDILQKGETVISERVIRRPDGSEIVVEMRTKMMPDHTYQSIYRDITQRKLAEEKIEALLAEKQLMLKEVHHRIKNNMNSVAGIMLLQAETLREPSAVAALMDAKNRVISMMLLYDKLYRSDDYKEISFNEYFSPLVDEIVNVFPNRKIVEIHKQIDDFKLDAQRMSLLGIIINELLTNIMKYAFNGRNCGTINLSANLSGGIVTIAIQDDGIGIPESIDISTAGGFGFQLLDILTRQLNGKIKIERANGTKFILEFNI